MKKFLTINNKTFKEHGVTTQKELWDKVKDDYEGFVIKTNVSFKEASEGNELKNKFHCIFSNAHTDRHGDNVLQNFELKNFKKNPVFLDSHDYSSIEKILGKVENIKVKDGQLQGDVVYNLESPLGLMARNMTANGFISATSIGFIPKDFNEKGEITKSELLEISAVSVPAHPEALFEKMMEIKEKTIEESTDNTPLEVVEDAEIKENGKVDIILNTNKKSLYKTITKMEHDHQKLLVSIARGLEIKNPHEKKRKLFKILRNNL